MKGAYRTIISSAVIAFCAVSVSACSWFSKEEKEELPSIAIEEKFSDEPNDWAALQAEFTYMLDPSESDVAEFERLEEFAVGKHGPVTHIRVVLVWIDKNALSEEDRKKFDRSGKKIDGNVLRKVTFLFDFDKSDLSQEELHKLEETIRSMKELPHRILVEGRTDSVGTKHYNQLLSERRAWTVRQKLVDIGADPDSIILRAYGETRPIASNKTEQGRAKNRSVQVRWYSKGK